MLQTTKNLFLFGGIPTPLKNMSSSGWIIIPNRGKNKKVPNHQPVFVFSVDKNPPMQLCGAYVVLFFVGVEVTSANHYSFTILEPLQNYIPQFRCKFQD